MTINYIIPQKVHYNTYWKHNQDAEYWTKWFRAQDQGLQFWQTKSFAIITHDSVPRDCIHRVISQKRGRVIFEGLATPRTAPKLTLKSNWFVQQQQQRQSIPKENVKKQLERGCALGKQERGMKRETSQEWRKLLETVGGTLQEWTLVLITANKKSLQMHPWKNEANSQEIKKSANWFEQNLCSRRPSERQDDIQWRIKPCYRRDGQCGADWVEENFDSMSIMSASRIWGYHYL